MMDSQSFIESDLDRTQLEFTEIIPVDSMLQDGHFNKLPMMHAHDTAWGFDMEISSDTASKTSWMFSTKLNKVFVKMNNHFHVTPKYKMIDPDCELFVRAMIVYSSNNDLAEPVRKCPNHKDQTRDDGNKDHILRCSVGATEYVGNKAGKTFGDRLAVVIPLNAIASNEPLKLEFTCQNSCSGGMNRKSTTLVFTLEDRYRTILGRNTLNFKVCSCPKRDKDKEEAAQGSKPLPKKRKAESTLPSTSKKVALPPVVKQESEASLQMEVEVPIANAIIVQMKQEQQPSCSLLLNLPNEEIKKKVLEQVFMVLSAEMTSTGDSKLHSYLTDVQKQIGKFQQ